MEKFRGAFRSEQIDIVILCDALGKGELRETLIEGTDNPDVVDDRSEIEEDENRINQIILIDE